MKIIMTDSDGFKQLPQESVKNFAANMCSSSEQGSPVFTQDRYAVQQR